MKWVGDELVEGALRELADESRQRELWLSKGYPEVSSFTECVCRLFDDSALTDALDRSGTVYTPEIDDRLRALGELLGGIDSYRPPEEILKDPQLDRARSMAQALLRDLSRFGYDRDS
ncbi:MAG: hypothetical protein DCC49_13090 [Acidobacteria bacterium]|nr:MAG: hypothetical protein DCC49_13090 [Acidobacteriota bacterium]